MTDLWYIGVDQVPESLAVLLDGRDRARRRRILREADRKRFLAAWVLSRLVLGEKLGRDPAGLSFDRTCAHCGDPEHGKPAVAAAGPGPGPDFSLSHAGELAVVAVSERIVGLDVENAENAENAELTEAGEQPPTPALTKREQAICVTYADFARLWTRKEAVLKAAGRGLAIHPARIEILGSTLRTLPAELGRPEDYTLRDLALPAPYVGSLAVRGSEPGPALSARSGAPLVRDAAQVLSSPLPHGRGHR